MKVKIQKSKLHFSKEQKIQTMLIRNLSSYQIGILLERVLKNILLVYKRILKLFWKYKVYDMILGNKLKHILVKKHKYNEKWAKVKSLIKIILMPTQCAMINI